MNGQNKSHRGHIALGIIVCLMIFIAVLAFIQIVIGVDLVQGVQDIFDDILSGITDKFASS